MSFVNLLEIIPEIPKSVSFHDYLSYKNYKLLKEKKYKGFECYKKQSDQFDDIIYVGTINNEENYYSVHYNDQGNIIDFVKNRIELEDHYEEFTPEKDHLIEACKEIVVYLHERGESKMNTSEEASKNDLKTLIEKSFTKHYNAVDLFDFKYLETLKIKQETVEHSLFKDRIFNSKGLKFNDKLYNDVINLAFPIYDIKEKECGLYYENILEINNKKKSKLEFFAPHSVKTGLWLSNEFEAKANQTIALTIVDRPNEAVSHFQYMKENRRYASVFDLEEVTLTQLTNLLNKGRTSLYLAFNVTIKSFIKEIRILISFLSIEHDIQFMQNNMHDIWIKVGAKEKKYFASFLKRVKHHNNRKAATVVGILGEHSEKFILKDMIKISSNDKDDLIVKVPKNFKTLYRLEKMLIVSFPKHIRIQIEKPMHLSWKEQNKRFFEVVNDERTLENYIQNEEIFVVTSN